MPRKPKKPKMVEVCALPNGCTLYRKPNEAGGYTYWSDEIGGGVIVWDTCLVDQSTLFCALSEEAKRAKIEWVRKNVPGKSKISW